MTIVATSMRIELTGIGPNAPNAAPEACPIPLPRRGHSHTTSAPPMIVFGEGSRRAESTLYGEISREWQAHPSRRPAITRTAAGIMAHAARILRFRLLVIVGPYGLQRISYGRLRKQALPMPKTAR